jgi:xanthine phosphoribosyltransferase
MVELIVSPEYLANGEKVLIIDDFLASGQTILGLARLAEASGSKIVGIGTLIEKLFESGREALKPLGVPIHSLACITSMDEGKIEFGNPV